MGLEIRIISSLTVLTLFAKSHNSCSAALCPDPAAIANGMMTFTGNSVHDTATYICSSGFELIGSATSTCIQVNASSAVFLPAAPECRGKYCLM